MFAELDALGEQRRRAQPPLTDEHGKLTAEGREMLAKVRAVPNYWKWDHSGPVAVVLAAVRRESPICKARPREAAPGRRRRGGASSRGGDSGDNDRPPDEPVAPAEHEGGAR